ncbi:hypothetical protein [Gimibacter soli]|uniref:Asparagine synthetase domain-containing protein n=1 Tax=Gimibacter soli TaxID=3024400 RepID=A0AAE9XTB4_9PROT|nr:hypothetical protein [Gimibacter soli]WCL52908.1 hypothetical protein PH603_10195 [Gimibacter soli]
MDFLVGQFREIERVWREIARLDFTAFSFNSEEIAVRKCGDYLLVGPERSFSERKAFFYDGHGFFGDLFVHTSHENSPRSSDVLNATAGVFSFASVDFQTGEVSIGLDPLSQYNLFVYSDADIKVATTSAYYLEAILRCMSKPLKRSFRVAAFEAAIGLGLGRQTGLEGVETLPVGYQIRANIHAKEWQICPAFSGVGLTANVDAPTTSVAADSLVKGVAAVHARFSRKETIFDLTGGIDSRLVLAASRAAGMRNQLISRMDDGVEEDVEIPNYIANKLALCRVNRPSNYFGETLDYHELMARSAFHQQGNTTSPFFDVGRWTIDGTCHLRGGFGELTRSYYRTKSRTNFWNLCKTLVPYFVRIRHGQQTSPTSIHYSSVLMRRVSKFEKLINKNFLNILDIEIINVLDSILNSDPRERNILENFYLVDRSRRHFGYMSQMLNRVRPAPEPLANIHLFNLSLSYGRSDRISGQPTYDLLKLLDPELLAMPISAGSLPGCKGQLNRYAGKLEYEPTGHISFEGSSGGVVPLESESIKDHIIDYLMSQRSDFVVWEYFNRSVFEGGAQEWDLAFLQKLYLGSLWYNGQESKVAFLGKKQVFYKNDVE